MAGFAGALLRHCTHPSTARLCTQFSTKGVGAVTVNRHHYTSGLHIEGVEVTLERPFLNYCEDFIILIDHRCKTEIPFDSASLPTDHVNIYVNISRKFDEFRFARCDRTGDAKKG